MNASTPLLVAIDEGRTVLVIRGNRVTQVLQASARIETKPSWERIRNLPGESVDGIVTAMLERGWFERVAFDDEKHTLMVRALRRLLEDRIAVQSSVDGAPSTTSVVSGGDPVSPPRA